MKYSPLIVFLLFSLLFAGCRNTYPKAENAFDAGREFIDGYLKGDFDKAKNYLLHNSINDADFETLKDNYRKKSNDEKVQYQQASITVLEESTVSNSVHIIRYQNSSNKKTKQIKVVQTSDGWLVDLAYDFDGNL